MRLAWNIARVVGYMLYSLTVYLPATLRGAAATDAAINRVYVGWAHYVLRIFGARMTVIDREHVPPPGAPRVLLSNHQSQLDIPALVASVGESTGFVAKKELGRIPLLSWWMKRVGCVFIDRGDKFAANKVMEATAKSLGAHPLVVFPEGTRSKTGQLLPVKLGGIRLAVQAQAHIIPVHIRGTRAALEGRNEGRNEARKSPGAVTVRYFPPFDARGLGDDKESWTKVKVYLEACWAAGERGDAE